MAKATGTGIAPEGAAIRACVCAGPRGVLRMQVHGCLLYTSDAADDLLCVDLGGRRIIKKKNKADKTHTSSKYTNDHTLLIL